MAYENDTPTRIFIECLCMIYNVVKELSVSIFRFFVSPPRKCISGEVVLITGSGGAIGRALSLRFSKIGATLVLWDINGKKNEETASLIKEQGGSCYAYTLDIGYVIRKMFTVTVR